MCCLQSPQNQGEWVEFMSNMANDDEYAFQCSGNAPCETCVLLGTKCIIDETLDGRRKVALNRRLEELYHYKWILEGLLVCLRTCRGRSLVGILELLLNDSSMPLLAVAICSALAKCPVPLGHDIRFAELQQNLANYVQENELAISCTLENGSYSMTLKEYGSETCKDILPPSRTSQIVRAMEQDPTKHSQYQSMESLNHFHSEANRQFDFFGESATFPGNLDNEIASVAKDIGLDVVVECLKAACMKIPQDELSKWHPGNCESFILTVLWDKAKSSQIGNTTVNQMVWGEIQPCESVIGSHHHQTTL